MVVIISESELAIAILNGLPDYYRALISSLETLYSNRNELIWQHVKARVPQEEQHINMCITSAREKPKLLFLFLQSAQRTIRFARTAVLTRGRAHCAIITNARFSASYSTQHGIG